MGRDACRTRPAVQRQSQSSQCQRTQTVKLYKVPPWTREWNKDEISESESNRISSGVPSSVLCLVHLIAQIFKDLAVCVNVGLARMRLDCPPVIHHQVPNFVWSLFDVGRESPLRGKYTPHVHVVHGEYSVGSSSLALAAALAAVKQL
jgi:hypothetical protein